MPPYPYGPVAGGWVCAAEGGHGVAGGFKCAWYHYKNKGMQSKTSLSYTFVMLAVMFNVCLIASNLFAVKLFCLFGRFTFSGAVVIFPITYIINDLLSEVYGYRKARNVIWLGFAMQLFFILASQLVLALPGADSWDGQEAFRHVFGAAPRAAAASLLAFLVGGTLNAMVMSLMKVAGGGRKFWLRALLSSLAGESADSLIFVPIVFWGLGVRVILVTMACQVVAKVAYELVILPLTAASARALKRREGVDTFDEGISYNPFRWSDV